MTQRHHWTRKQILEAKHDFAENIKRYLGEVWRIPTTGEYRGVDYRCGHPVALYGGLWRLCQAAKHKGATRAAGRIEIEDAGTVLRFILFFNPVEKETIQ